MNALCQISFHVILYTEILSMNWVYFLEQFCTEQLSRTRGARLKGRYYAEVIYMDFDSGH